MIETKIFTRTFPAQLSEMDNFLAYTEEIMEGCDCPFKVITQITLALEELFVNVASHAYPEGNGTLDYTIMADDGKMTFIMEDSGVPFDPLAKKDPDITLSVEERDIGGLGIYMVKNIMSEINYSYTDGKNVLTLIKNL